MRTAFIIDCQCSREDAREEGCQSRLTRRRILVLDHRRGIPRALRKWRGHLRKITAYWIGYASPGRTIRMKWSVNFACISGT
jgi:hypothetical protein